MLPGSASYGSADPIYDGDNAKWKKFANSLHARYAIQLSNVDPARAKSELAAALAGPVFTSNDDNAVLVWPGDGQNNNPYFDNFKTRDDHRLSSTIVDTLLALSDPRVAVYADPTQAYVEGKSTNEYVGLPNGLTNTQASAFGGAGGGLYNASHPAAFFSQADSPSYLMTYAELLFIKAEAAARGWISGDPAALYADGITASMQQFGIDDAAIATYLAQPKVQYNPSTGLTQIALQKWIALFGEGLEGWNEYRRTGVPNLQAGPGAVINTVPRRLPYPSSEQSFNPANLEAARSAQGGDALTSKLWWDQ